MSLLSVRRAFNLTRSVEPYAPPLSIQALRKPLETEVENNSPTRMPVDHYNLSCFRCLEVSQASYTQDENITPRYIFCLGLKFSIQIQK